MMPPTGRFIPPRVRGITRANVRPLSKKTWWEQYSDSLKGNNAPHCNPANPTRVTAWKPGSIPPAGTPLQLGQMENTIDEIMRYINPPFRLSSPQHSKRIQVVGGIQSGKTASMIGLAAKALDSGFKIIIVLSGSTDLLRNQSAKRFHQQLLCVNEKLDDIWAHPSSAATTPTPIIKPGYPNYGYHFFEHKEAGYIPSHIDLKLPNHEIELMAELLKIRQGSQEGVFVIKKNNRTMQKFARILAQAFQSSSSLEEFPIMILDDESDDRTCPKINTVAQAFYEQINPPPRTVRPTLIPPTSLIAMEFQYGLQPVFLDLFRKDLEFPTCTVAYTATPQGPLLHNEDFLILDAAHSPHRLENPFRPQKAVLMKRPSDVNTPWSFAVAGNYDGWYTGASLFNDDDCTMNERHPPRGTLSNPGPLLVTGTVNPGASLLTSRNPIIAPPMFGYDDVDLPTSGATNALENSLISYLISGAIRMGQQPGMGFTNPNDLFEAHTMMVHDDRTKIGHVERAIDVITIMQNGVPITPKTLVALTPDKRLDIRLVTNWIKSPKFITAAQSWYDFFEMRQHEIVVDSAVRTSPFPSFSDVVDIHLPELVENLKIRVINSMRDFRLTGDREYSWDCKINASTGMKTLPNDIATIFVGGDILGRGLTLENLVTTFFLRGARTPQQSTTMQRQRWMGYRGKLWEFVTLHSSESILSELRTDSWSEEQYLSTLHNQIISGFTPRITPMLAVNAGGRGRAAGQSNTMLHLRYSLTPFLDYVEPNSPDNLSLLDDIINQLDTDGYSPSWASPPHGGTPGLVSDLTYSASDIADWLDALRYSFHGPPPASNADREYKVYKHLEATAGLNPGDFVIDPSVAVGLTSNNPTLSPAKDPYLIAAYLRLWEHVTTTGATAKGLLFGNPVLQMDDAPRFKVAIAYGSQNTGIGGINIDPQSKLPGSNDWNVHRTINPNNQLSSPWRGHSRTYPGGDRFIDFDPTGTTWYAGRVGYARPAGESLDGLLVIHILDDGTATTPPTVTFGLSIPEGGPHAAFSY